MLKKVISGAQDGTDIAALIEAFLVDVFTAVRAAADQPATPAAEKEA